MEEGRPPRASQVGAGRGLSWGPGCHQPWEGLAVLARAVGGVGCREEESRAGGGIAGSFLGGRAREVGWAVGFTQQVWGTQSSHFSLCRWDSHAIDRDACGGAGDSEHTGVQQSV